MALLNCGTCRRRRSGDHRLLRVKPVTLKEYRRALKIVVDWLDENNMMPPGGQEWDAAACQYSALQGLSHGQMSTLVAALELFFPRFKRLFLLTKADAEGLLSTTPIEHEPLGGVRGQGQC